MQYPYYINDPEGDGYQVYRTLDEVHTELGKLVNQGGLANVSWGVVAQEWDSDGKKTTMILPELATLMSLKRMKALLLPLMEQLDSLQKQLDADTHDPAQPKTP